MPVTLTTKSRRFMPNPTAATLDTPSAYTGTAVSVDLSRTGWHDITLKEQAASRGAYQAGDQFISLGVEELGDTVPGVGWRVTHGETGTVYTVLEVVRANYLGFYRCTGRNLALAAGLTDSVDLQHPTITSDSAAGRSESWSNIRTSISCRVQPDDTLPFDGRGVRAAERKYLVYLDPSTGSGSTFAATNSAGDFGRLVFGSVYLQIEHYRDAERIGDLPVASCRRLP